MLLRIYDLYVLLSSYCVWIFMSSLKEFISTEKKMYIRCTYIHTYNKSSLSLPTQIATSLVGIIRRRC